MIPIFNDIQKKKADFIITNKHAKLSSLTSSEIKDLAVVWCYYSGKIEGNTYTYVETEALLKDNILKSATPFPKCYLHKEKWTFDS